MEREVWFKLMDEAGRDVASLASVDCAENASVNRFLREVFSAFSPALAANLIAADLTVYADRATYDAKLAPLKVDLLLSDLDDDHARLIVVAPLRPRKRQRTMWQKTVTLDLAAPVLSPLEGGLVKLDPGVFAGFGLRVPSNPSAKLCLYYRHECKKLISFLRTDVLHGGKTGYILRPQGTGKSTTAAAFALDLACTTDWVFTWIHLVRKQPPLCVRLEGSTKKTKMDLTDQEGLRQILDDAEDTKNHFVILDGVTDANGAEEKTCFEWLRANWANRRLVMVMSMDSRRKANLDDDETFKVKDHVVPSWTVDDYLEAVKHDELLESVESFLDASVEESPSREELVEAKYYFAGGNARYMFGWSTATVMTSLDDAVNAVCNLVNNKSTAIAGSVKTHSTGIISHLFGKYGDARGIISRYAASALALAGGSELIKRFSSFLKFDSNAATDGWILEMYFFTCIREGGLTLKTCIQEGGFVFIAKTATKFPKSAVLVVNPKKLPRLPKRCWLKPKKYNQGGYDAVYIDKEHQLVRFVQVAKGDRHSLLIQYFKDCLDALKKREMPRVNLLEIFVVVEKQKIAKFKVSKVVGVGGLANFGWRTGEEMENVKRAVLKGVGSWDAIRW